MKRGTPDHPKMSRLAETLGIPKAYAVGLLEMLWHFTGRFAPRGDIGRYPDSDIARAVGWETEPSKLIHALLQEGWIDSDNAYRLLIHDWPEHCEQAVRKYLSRNKLRFARKSGRRPDAVKPAPSGPPLPLPLPMPEPMPKPTTLRPSVAVVPTKPESEFPSRRAANVYLRHYPKGEPPGAMFKVLRPLVVEHTWDVVEPELEAYLERTAIDYHSWPKFAAGFGSWASPNGTALARVGPQARPPTTAAEKTAAAVEQVLRESGRQG